MIDTRANDSDDDVMGDEEMERMERMLLTLSQEELDKLLQEVRSVSVMLGYG